MVNNLLSLNIEENILLLETNRCVQTLDLNEVCMLLSQQSEDKTSKD